MKNMYVLPFKRRCKRFCMKRRNDVKSHLCLFVADKHMDGSIGYFWGNIESLLVESDE